MTILKQLPTMWGNTIFMKNILPGGSVSLKAVHFASQWWKQHPKSLQCLYFGPFLGPPAVSHMTFDLWLNNKVILKVNLYHTKFCTTSYYNALMSLFAMYCYYLGLLSISYLAMPIVGLHTFVACTLLPVVGVQCKIILLTENQMKIYKYCSKLCFSFHFLSYLFK